MLVQIEWEGEVPPDADAYETALDEFDRERARWRSPEPWDQLKHFRSFYEIVAAKGRILPSGRVEIVVSIAGQDPWNPPLPHPVQRWLQRRRDGDFELRPKDAAALTGKLNEVYFGSSPRIPTPGTAHTWATRRRKHP